MKLNCFFLLFSSFLNLTCFQTKTVAPKNTTENLPTKVEKKSERIVLGAERISEYLPFLKGKKIGLVVNQTSMLGERHLADTLLSLGVDIKTIFAPEHGFRGKADAGEHVANGKDVKTGLPIVSLYGKNKRPNKEMLQNLDVLLFDIQDVGVRFYTYISTLHYVMDACAEYDKSLLVLDRPNPNGHYVDGPMLDKKFQSFVGLDPIPVVHGLTVGEYARMVNGEKWLECGKQCKLQIVDCQNYTHQMPYALPVVPSPNLTTMQAIYLYPSLCFFEGTNVSVGRGTDKPFTVVGCPDFTCKSDFSFTPQANESNKTPLLLNKKCIGFDFSKKQPEILRQTNHLDLSLLLTFYNCVETKKTFFLENNFMDKLAGTDALRKAILAGKTMEEIRAGWKVDLDKYMLLRKKYLVYL
jgi:uncharacterized protein YbbC (DUF1343 family)